MHCRTIYRWFNCRWALPMLLGILAGGDASLLLPGSRGSATAISWTESAVQGAEPRDTQSAPPAPRAPNFRTVHSAEQLRMFQAIADYVKSHPQANDANEAAHWLFTQAQESPHAARMTELAQVYAERPGVTADLKRLARQTWALGLARSGKTTEAAEQFSLTVQGARFQRSANILPFAHNLATGMRMSGDFAGARGVYEKLQELFPLDPRIADVAASRIARLELAGKPAPPLQVNDLSGTRLTWEKYRGQVVLLDFWGTNCLPCIEELPHLMRIYQEYHPRGLEFIGVSLDEQTEAVSEFRETHKVPWPLVMNSAAEGTLAKRFGVILIPAILVVDRQGKIAQVDVHGDDLHATLETLLSQKPAPP